MAILTKRQRELKNQYISIVKEWGGYRAEFAIGCQSFGISYASTNKKDAEWIGKMFAIALDGFLKEQS